MRRKHPPVKFATTRQLVRQADAAAAAERRAVKEKAEDATPPLDAGKRKLLRQLAAGRPVRMREAEEAAGLAPRRARGGAADYCRNPGLWNSLFDAGLVTFPLDYHAQITAAGLAAVRKRG